MNTQPAQVSKCVSYAYATSPNAVKFGFGATGCFTVETVVHNPEPKPPVAVAGFKTEDKAKAFAETLPFPWDQFTR